MAETSVDVSGKMPGWSADMADNAALAEIPAHILLVDDDQNFLGAMASLLEGPRRTVLTADTGQSALRYLLRHDCAVIVLDVRMPQMDGFELAKLIRQRDRSRFTPIIFLSGVDTMEADVVRGISSGAVDYLVKPVPSDILRHKVDVFVELFQLREWANKQTRKQSEERFRLLVEGIEDYAIVLLDLDGKVATWNRGGERLTGYASEEILGQPYACFYPPEEVALPDDDLKQAIEVATGQAVRADIDRQLVKKDGSRFIATVMVTALRDERKALQAYAVVIRNVTERKQAEAGLARLAAIVQSSDDAIISKDPDGVITSWNEGAQRLFGYRADEVIGLPIAILIPSGRQVEERGILARVLSGESTTHYETVRRRKDGSLVDVFLTVSPIRDARGRIIGASKIARDITEWKQAEEEVRQSEQRLRLATEVAAIGIWEWNVVTNEICWDAQMFEIYGVTPTDDDIVSYQAWSEAVLPEDLPEQERILWDTVRRKGRSSRTFRIKRKHDGACRYIEAVETVRTNERGETEWVVGTNLDVTERRLSEEALREAQEQLQRWNVELEQAVHVKTAELRQSQERLRAMATDLNLAEQRERKRLATELHDHLQQMLVFGKIKLGQGQRQAKAGPEAAKLMKETDDVLSDALKYTRTLVAELSPIVLRDHGLAAGLKWLGEYMHKHQLAVTVIVPEDALTLPEDQAVLLFQSVRELLINSAKHAGTGQATVALEQRDGLVRIEVRDEGTGFDLAAAAAAAAAGTPGGEISSKYGLFSIQERMKALGGSFDIESAPGKGTTATLMLPLGGGAAARTEELGLRTELSDGSALKAQHSALPGRSALQQHTNRVRVLLVDDHAMVRQGLRSLLDAYNDIQVVGEAQDGAEAVRLVGKLQPQVVVMDINMPKMNGIEATMRIKTQWPETIVVGISVNTGDANGEAMTQAGAAVLLTKEAAVDELYRTIQDVLKTNVGR